MQKVILAFVMVFLVLGLMGSCSSSPNKYVDKPSSAEEVASHYYYDSQGHIRYRG